MDLLKLGGIPWIEELSSLFTLLSAETVALNKKEDPALEETKRNLCFRLEALRVAASKLAYGMEDLCAEIALALKDKGQIIPAPDQASRIKELELQKELAKMFVIPFTLTYAKLAEREQL